ncbi:AAA domain-containing protein [Fusarium sp. Ph1]|nr:AAA domain-containing protein [Fusarium sp. Ph1]
MAAVPAGMGNAIPNFDTALGKPTMDKTISQDHSNYHGHIFSTAQERQERAFHPPRPVQQRLDKQGVNTQRARHETPSPEPASEDGDRDDGQSHGGGGNSEIFSEQKAADLAQRLAEQLTAKLNDLVGEGSPPDSITSRVMDNLVSTISRLQVQSEMLKEELEHIKTAGLTSLEEEVIRDETESNCRHEPVKSVTLHRVRCSNAHDDQVEWRAYLDRPRLFKGDTENCHFRGTIQVDDDDYLEDHPECAFAVVKDYYCTKVVIRWALTKEGQAGRHGQVLGQDHYPDEPEESIIWVNEAAQDGIKAILEAFPNRFPGFQNPPDLLGLGDADSMDDHFQGFSRPYFLFYLYGKTLIEALEEVEMDDLMRKSLLSLCQWMESNYREEWDEADALFAQGKVNQGCLNILFQPGELVVHHGFDKNRSASGAIVPWFPSNTSEPGRQSRFCSWEFNGHLTRLWRSSVVPPQPRWVRSQYNRVVDITSLMSYPLRFAPGDLKAKLIARGQRFWAFRRQKLVCYNENDQDGIFRVERRFMIDYDMYRRLHPFNGVFRRLYDPDWGGDELMGIEEPPEDFLYCLPPTIHGFDFTTKTWKTLDVDRITEVTWNKRAFSQLVAPPETKELIQAVVSAHGERKNMGLDIIEGKGQGLLVLLHGGPGTGKTLTAESIAEEQERPLYRVTCGDIGTEPREVERYLGDVLEIGRAWGCVVLLDEADVFLEERSFSDQKRNAIISIFLRILEYYDGILILTTNRIGSFDEAFKSRIQLALGYPTLNEEDRLKIWSNFVQMLPRTKDRVDMEDLQMNLPKLARDEINGREIRNIITTARHLAKFRKETLRYQHMRDALRSSQKFSEYLNQVKGVSDDDWARADKLR